jgi:hypothetical protein
MDGIFIDGYGDGVLVDGGVVVNVMREIGSDEQ